MGKVNIEADIPQIINYVATTVNVGSTTTLPSGAEATVTNSGTDKNAILNFGIPKGTDGVNGKSAYQQAVEGGYQGTEEEFEQALASDIATVANNVTNINVVGNNIENVNTAVDNMAAIIAAPTAATQAASSASQAATSATNAQTSETNAATSASNASASATNASASATIATTKASEATASATSASASATSASESATSASISAANAEIWAEGTDAQVTTLGGEHSSKGWANVSKQYADSIDLSNYRTSSDQDIIDATKATKTELAGYLPLSSKSVANGVASLDANAKVPAEQIPAATASALGGVKPDGNTITVTEDGTISAAGGSGSGFDFEGTKAEFDAAVAAGTITNESVSLITDDVDGAEVATKAELQAVDRSKADTSLSNVLANIDYVVESKFPTAADPSWYRKYKSGWIEQGGLAKSNADVTVTLLKPFVDTNYSVQCTNRRLSTSDGWGWIFVLNITTTSFMARACYAGGDITDINAMWEAKGQGAE